MVFRPLSPLSSANKIKNKKPGPNKLRQDLISRHRSYQNVGNLELLTGGVNKLK